MIKLYENLPGPNNIFDGTTKSDLNSSNGVGKSSKMFIFVIFDCKHQSQMFRTTKSKYFIPLLFIHIKV